MIISLNSAEHVCNSPTIKNEFVKFNIKKYNVYDLQCMVSPSQNPTQLFSIFFALSNGK